MYGNGRRFHDPFPFMRRHRRTTRKSRYVPRRSYRQKALPMELKFFDLDIDNAGVPTAGTTLNSVNLVVQGIGENQRIGRKITIRSINWRFSISKAEGDGVADPTNPDVVRLIVYLDKQANGATAAPTDILETANYQSFNNLANKGRFRTLMDRKYDMNSPSGAGDGVASDWAGVVVSDDWFKKVNIPIEFDAAAGAIGSVKSNNIGVLLISLSNQSTFDSKMRIRFSDA